MLGHAHVTCRGYVLFEDVLFPVVLKVSFISKFEGLCYLCVGNAWSVHNRFDHFTCMFVLESHLSM